MTLPIKVFTFKNCSEKKLVINIKIKKFIDALIQSQDCKIFKDVICLYKIKVIILKNKIFQRFTSIIWKN